MDIEDRINRLEAKQMVMAALLHAVADTSQQKAAIAQAFRERADGIEALLRLRPEETDLYEAFAIARLAVEHALDEAPATH